MDQHLRRDRIDDAGPGEQVGLVPAHAVARVAARRGRDGVHLMARGHQLLRHVAADEAGRPGEQQPAHGAKSGYSASRRDMMRPAGGGAGHSIPNAGSSQRTPRAASGT